MYNDDNWAPVEGEYLQGFLDQINPIDGKYKVSAQTSKVSWRQLPFYDNVVLVRVQDPMWSPGHLTIFYLTEQGNLFRLNGTSPPIHEVNAKAPVKITEDNVLDYLKFFCFFVRGEEGPFLIAEDMNNPDMPKNMDPKTLSVIEGTVRPATYEGKNEQGFFLCDAVVFYSNALFIANFAIQPSGMIEMLEDEPIAADLPVKVDAPIS
ncbi:MAG: hypothetical protein JWO78_609 [Micavibrio sp.]|nr:hypothetical protein [Micavibrio sp.]